MIEFEKIKKAKDELKQYVRNIKGITDVTVAWSESGDYCLKIKYNSLLNKFVPKSIPLKFKNYLVQAENQEGQIQLHTEGD